MIIAQISDMHVRAEGQLAYGRVDTAALLARCVADIARLPTLPDVVVATGDLVDGGLPAEYARLRKLLAPLDVPVFLLPGNHDDRATLAEAFPEHRYLPRGEAFLHYVVDDYPVRLVAVDTVVPGKTGGRLCPERLAWLAARLEEAPARPTAVVMHHPPFRTGIRHMDDLGLENPADVAAIVGRHPQVERVLCGHVHRAIHARWAGTVASTAPSTAHQIVLDVRQDAPLHFVMEPAGFQLHVWQPGLGLVSHTAVVGPHDGPFSFSGHGPSRPS
jgi:Icc protein